jgi:hypothetical protein
VEVAVAEQFLADAGALHEEADVELIGHAHTAVHLHAFLQRLELADQLSELLALL